MQQEVEEVEEKSAFEDTKNKMLWNKLLPLDNCSLPKTLI